MQITLANATHIPEVVSFFNENLNRNNSAVDSEEFLCSFGVKAAIRRKQMIVVTVEGFSMWIFK